MNTSGTLARAARTLAQGGHDPRQLRAALLDAGSHCTRYHGRMGFGADVLLGLLEDYERQHCRACHDGGHHGPEVGPDRLCEPCRLEHYDECDGCEVCA